MSGRTEIDLKSFTYEDLTKRDKANLDLLAKGSEP